MYTIKPTRGTFGFSVQRDGFTLARVRSEEHGHLFINALVKEYGLPGIKVKAKFEGGRIVHIEKVE